MPKAAALSVADLLRDKLGTHGFPRVNPELTSVGLAAAVVFKQKPQRLAFIIVNLSVNALFAAPAIAGPPTSARGIRLNQSGGNLHLFWRDDFDLVTYEWLLIADGAASDVFSVEILTA